MTKIDRPALVAQIHYLSKVESEFEQLLNLPERQVSSHDASMFDGEKEAIENNDVESEEGSAWGQYHIAPLSAQVPLYQGANKAANVNLSMAVNGSRPKSQLRDSHPSEASQHGPRQSEPLSSSSARPVLNTKVLNAQVASTQVSNTQAIGTQTAVAQVASTQISSTQATGTQTANAQVLSAEAVNAWAPSAQVLGIQTANAQVASTQISSTQATGAQVASTQVSSTQATATQTANAQALSAQAVNAQAPSDQVSSTQVSSTQTASSQGPDMQVLSQKVASIKVFSTTASVVTQGNIQLEANIDGITSTETLKRLSSLTPSQPPQLNNAVGRDSMADAPVLMSKVPVQKAPVSKESMPQVPAQKAPVSKESMPQVPAQKASVSKESMPQVPAQKASVSKESMPQVPAQKALVSKESTAAARPLERALVSQSVDPSVNQVQSESSANQTIRLQSVVTPPKPEQSSVAVGREPMADTPVLMSKVSAPQIPMLAVPAQKEPVSKEPVPKLPVSKESTVASKLGNSSVDQHERSIASKSVAQPDRALASKFVDQSMSKLVRQAQSEPSTNQPIASEAAKLQPALTPHQPLKPHQPPQPSAAMGREPVTNAPGLMSKLPVAQESMAASKFVDPSIGMLVRQAQSEPSTTQPNAGEAAKLQPVLTPLKSVTQMQPESSTNRAVEVRGDTHVEKTAGLVPLLVPLNAQARENDTQASVVLTQEASPVLMTRMELFGVGAKLAALGAGNMLTSVQPILSSPMLHYQIAPEYFTHYAQLNTYRVFFRNKYYLFQFEDHKVTNFLEDYYDRH